jgi:hypothetical protein
MLTKTRTSMFIAALPVAAALAFAGPAAAGPPAAKPPRAPVADGSHRAGPPAARPARRSHKRRTPRLARVADYGHVSAECNRSPVGGGGVLSVSLATGFPFGYAPGQQYYGRLVAYVGSRFVALSNWQVFTAWTGGATGWNPSANEAVIGGTGAPGTSFGNFIKVPGGTWAAGGVQTWTQSGGYRDNWLIPQAWGLRTSGVWCYLP